MHVYDNKFSFSVVQIHFSGIHDVKIYAIHVRLKHTVCAHTKHKRHGHSSTKCFAFIDKTRMYVCVCVRRLKNAINENFTNINCRTLFSTHSRHPIRSYLCFSICDFSNDTVSNEKQAILCGKTELFYKKCNLRSWKKNRIWSNPIVALEKKITATWMHSFWHATFTNHFCIQKQKNEQEHSTRNCMDKFTRIRFFPFISMFLSCTHTHTHGTQGGKTILQILLLFIYQWSSDQRRKWMRKKSEKNEKVGRKCTPHKNGYFKSWNEVFKCGLCEKEQKCLVHR